MKKKQFQIIYCCMQALYWMLFCVAVGYTNAYLTRVGIEPSIIGIIVAISGAVSALIQPVLGKLSDQKEAFRWDRQLSVLLIATIILYGCQIFTSNPIVAGLLQAFVFFIAYVMMPPLNSVSFLLSEQGVSMNYGVARGFGSMFYAIISFFLGNWVAGFGTIPLQISGIGLCVLMLLFLCILKKCVSNEAGLQLQINNKEDQKSTSSATSSWGAFIRQYKSFCFVLVGFVLCLSFHNISCTYALQMVQAVGGTEAEMGTMYSISAFVEIPIMFLFSYIVKKLSTNKLLILVGLGFFVKSLCYALSTSVLALYLTQFFQMFAFGLFAAVSVYYANEVMDLKDKQRGQALVGSATTLGGVIGNLIGGAWVQSYGIYFALKGAMFLALAGAILIILTVALSICDYHKSHSIE